MSPSRPTLSLPPSGAASASSRPAQRPPRPRPRTTLATAFGGDLRSVDTRGDLARGSSTQVALEPFRTPASAPFGSPSARGYAVRGRAGSSVAAPLRLPNGLAWTSIPASEGACPKASPKFATSVFPLGRGSRLSGGCASAFSLSRFAPCADSQRTRARRGDLRRQNGRGNHGRKTISHEFCRARFPPCGGRLALGWTMPRAAGAAPAGKVRRRVSRHLVRENRATGRGEDKQPVDGGEGY